MGRKIDKMKAWFDAKFDSAVELTDMEKVNLAIAKLQSNADSIEENYYRSMAEKEFTKTEIKNAKAILEKIEKAAVACKNDEVNLKQLFSRRNAIQSTLKLHEETLVVQAEIGEKLFKVRAAAIAKLEEATQLKSQLEIKERYANSVNQYKSFVKEDSSEELSIDDALKGIEVKYTMANFKLEDLNTQNTIDEIINNVDKDDEFERWRNDLK